MDNTNSSDTSQPITSNQSDTPPSDPNQPTTQLPKFPMKSGFSITIILVVIIILLMASSGYLALQNIQLRQQIDNGGSVTPPRGDKCTLEAKICPDGSSVGRTGPNCEFAPCPQQSGTTNIIIPPVVQECTLETKTCPDGSPVGRVGPDCEFASCPGWTCPDQEILDCTPCTTGPCREYYPAYCEKGSVYYNWIINNCPDVTIIGLD